MPHQLAHLGMSLLNLPLSPPARTQSQLREEAYAYIRLIHALDKCPRHNANVSTSTSIASDALRRAVADLSAALNTLPHQLSKEVDILDRSSQLWRD